MVYPRSLRGDINAIQNPLVANGVIKGFSTNLFGKPPPERPIVTVAVHSRDGAEEAYRTVTRALEPLGQGIIVSVDLPEALERPEQDSVA